MDSEIKMDSTNGIAYAFASEEPCFRNGKPVSAVKIDKDTLLDRVLKGAVVCREEEESGNDLYFNPIDAATNNTSNGASFTEITILDTLLNDTIMKMRLVSSEANLKELGNSGKLPSGTALS